MQAVVRENRINCSLRAEVGIDRRNRAKSPEESYPAEKQPKSAFAKSQHSPEFPQRLNTPHRPTQNSLTDSSHPLTPKEPNQQSLQEPSDIPRKIGVRLFVTIPCVPAANPKVGAAGGVISIVITRKIASVISSVYSQQ
ncbi:MAG: hypothetical protein MUC48_22450 [Leptolyngbya sp. Prado105]|jgi:hypothetical protein|nr:hypothetical protein [Leptolyngbya sp. Prado105]